MHASSKRGGASRPCFEEVGKVQAETPEAADLEQPAAIEQRACESGMTLSVRHVLPPWLYSHDSRTMHKATCPANSKRGRISPALRRGIVPRGSSAQTTVHLRESPAACCRACERPGETLFA